MLSLLNSSLLKGTATTFALKFGGLAAGLLMHFLLVRSMVAADYGVFSFVLSLSMVASVVGRLALDVSGIKVLTMAVENRRDDLAKGSIIWFVVITILFSFFVSVGLYLYSVYSITAVILLAIPLSICISFTAIAQGVLRVFGRNVLAFSPDMLGRPLISSLIVISLLFLYGAVSLEQALHAQLFAAGGMMVFSWLALYFVAPLEIRQSATDFRHKEWFGIVLPVFLGTFLLMGELHFTILLAGWLLTPAETGVASLCLRLAALASLAAVAVNMYITPRLASGFQVGDIDGLKAIVRGSSIIMVAPTAVAMGLYVFYGEYLLNVFGAVYFEYKWLLILFTLARLMPLIFGPVDLLMQMGGMERENAFLTAISLSLYIVVCILVVPTYGLAGLAVLACLFMFGRQGIAWYFVNDRLNIRSGVW